MTHNDRELEATQERIRRFENLLAAARGVESPANYTAMASGYLQEIRKMQAAILACLAESPHTSQAA